ncbi:MAG: S23 ribosomal protein [Candidatus Roizmanbacteria bacterium GW2011_GWB1_40_7]|uniref:S23 ribosomal protein n=1 Tax=Candidatus Roizmanbacteria bacterium GW2011_GWB1_40_7 TaxID=1618482 RepID=A0A0G0W675_9BACT|nr:MAG: S23 ribosomal protein [Candidatus Levybacteria bacterium GW2011_GWA1_37_16]KKR70747.1 MAG: S23 ribosomal protein [Candidatus Roizmanbacteria bacterium GW2011_GWB1_40_7]OGH50524.1 MAG: hypothetical protein A3H17_04315 [Candidatus Levybacteria bacterium RIFCSPLOWO2_12_FULL_37_14]
MGNFTNLKIWQNSHKLTLEVYILTSSLPKEELFGLTSQLRRAAISVESNIAEGESRYTQKDKLNFFIQARSSAAEVQTQLFLIHDIYSKLSVKANELKNEYEILSKQINSLITFRRNRI